MAAQSSESELEFPFNTSREFELRLGSSFHSKGGPKMAFHTIRYDFKPASVDTSRPAELVVGDKNEVTVTVPNVQDSGNTVYRGSKRSCTKEFILVVDKEKKTFTLERIESTVPQLKKVRYPHKLGVFWKKRKVKYSTMFGVNLNTVHLPLASLKSIGVLQWSLYELLATGCIDISNYIAKTPGKVDVTVTLKPAIKKVVSVPQMKRYGKR
nr:ELL-associated factor 2-like [Pocillopora verrucosa]